MKFFSNGKFVLLTAVLMLVMALAPYAYAMSPQNHSMEVNDCSASMDCLACGNSLPASIRIDYSLSESLDVISTVLIPEVVSPAVSHYHPPG